VYQDGEELRYKVTWTIFRLGTLTVKTFRDSTCTLPTDFKVAFVVASNPDLAFIWIHGYYESLMDTEKLTSRRFWALQRDGEEFIEIQQILDFGGSRIFYTQIDRNAGSPVIVDTIQNVDSCVEGPSLIFFARSVSHLIGLFQVPTIVDGKMGTTELVFRGEKEEIQTGIQDEPIRTRRYTGTTHWQSEAVAGFSGNFTGWVSDDSAAVPIRAEMKVFVGSIVLELERWNRPTWTPPIGLIETTNTVRAEITE
jgi:hypothetical protein